MSLSKQLILSSNKNGSFNRETNLNFHKLSLVEPNEQLQRRHKLAHCLPYSAQLEASRLQAWTQLKEHFTSALLEGGQSLSLWTRQMDAYLNVHSYAFTKTEHIQLVQGLWTAVQHMKDDLPLLVKVVPLLNRLLR